MNPTHTWTVQLQAQYGHAVATLHPLPITHRLSLSDVLLTHGKHLVQTPSTDEWAALNQCRFLEIGQTDHATQLRHVWQLQNMNRTLNCVCNKAIIAYGESVVLTVNDESFDVEFGLFHFHIAYQTWASISPDPDGSTLQTSNEPLELAATASTPPPAAALSHAVFNLTDLAQQTNYSQSAEAGLVFDIQDGVASSSTTPNNTSPTLQSPLHATALNAADTAKAQPQPAPRQAALTSTLQASTPTAASSAVMTHTNVSPLAVQESQKSQENTGLNLEQSDLTPSKELAQLHTDYLAVVKDPTLLLDKHGWQSFTFTSHGADDEFNTLIERAKKYSHIHEVIQEDQSLMAVVNALDNQSDSSILDPEKKIDILMLFAPEDLKHTIQPMINRLTGFTAQEHHITSLDSAF